MEVNTIVFVGIRITCSELCSYVVHENVWFDIHVFVGICIIVYACSRNGRACLKLAGSLGFALLRSRKRLV